MKTDNSVFRPNSLELVDLPPQEDEALWQEIEDAIAVAEPSLLAESDPAAWEATDDLGLRQMQETLLEIVGFQLSPLCRYMKALAQGEESREIFEISEIVVHSLIPRVEEVQLRQALEELVFFRSLLLLTMEENDQHALEKLKEILLEGFDQLKQSFKLDYRGYRIAVRNLVDFYRAMNEHPEIADADVRRFFSIGIPSLTWIRKTQLDEIVSLSGIKAETIREIKKLAKVYNTLPAPARAMGRGFRRDLAQDLMDKDDSAVFPELAATWEDLPA